MKKRKLDLKRPVPKVVDSQSEKACGQLLYKQDGLYARASLRDNFFQWERASRRLKAESDWFEKIVPHAPSVGSFYESIIKALLKEQLPDRFHLGHGFIYSTHQESASKQLDLIVYENATSTPLVKVDDFVVVVPSAVRAVAEIKKTLELKDLDSLVRDTMYSNFGIHPRSTRQTKPFLPLTAVS